jgi:hypothetical protein
MSSAAIERMLIPNEQTRFAELELVIDRGLRTFIEVGDALREIRDSRLYRETGGTFEEYVKARWGWSRRRAYQLIAGADVAGNVNPGSHATEKAFRPLVGLPPEEQREAWESAVDSAPDGSPTAADVALAVEGIHRDHDHHEDVEEECIDLRMYRVVGTVEAANLRDAKKQIKIAFPAGDLRVERPKQMSRASRLEQARAIVEDLKCEIESWKENLQENLQQGEKAARLEECEAALDEVLNALDGVEFPGMF